MIIDILRKGCKSYSLNMLTRVFDRIAIDWSCYMTNWIEYDNWFISIFISRRSAIKLMIVDFDLTGCWRVGFGNIFALKGQKTLDSWVLLCAQTVTGSAEQLLAMQTPLYFSHNHQAASHITWDHLVYPSHSFICSFICLLCMITLMSTINHNHTSADVLDNELSIYNNRLSICVDVCKWICNNCFRRHSSLEFFGKTLNKMKRRKLRTLNRVAFVRCSELNGGAQKLHYSAFVVCRLWLS